MVENKHTILIADDDEVMCQTLSDVLKKMSYDVSSIQTGNDALSLLQDNGFDLILLDIRLPDINGLDILKKIKNH